MRIKFANNDYKKKLSAAALVSVMIPLIVYSSRLPTAWIPLWPYGLVGAVSLLLLPVSTSKLKKAKIRHPLALCSKCPLYI